MPNKNKLTKGKKKPNPKHVCHFCKRNQGDDEGYCYGCKANVCQFCSVLTPCGPHEPMDHRIKNLNVNYLD